MTTDQGTMTTTESHMTIEECLDEDFSASLYERVMRDLSTIPRALSGISAAINAVRVERDEAMSRFDETLAHLEELAAALQAKTRGALNRANAHRHSVTAKARPPRGLNNGSKKDRVRKIVVALCKETGVATISEIANEMENLGLFENVTGNKIQNATNKLYELKQSGHLNSDGRGKWYPANGRAGR
jgi:hypothetical protein